MSEFFDLETGEKCRDKAHADELYRAGHRIKVYHDGKPLVEWIPGSSDYYVFDNGTRRLVKYVERKCWHPMTGEEG